MLVGGLEHVFFLNILGIIIIPTDELHHFAEGLGQPPTRTRIFLDDARMMAISRTFAPSLPCAPCCTFARPEVWEVWLTDGSKIIADLGTKHGWSIPLSKCFITLLSKSPKWIIPL